MTVDVKDFAGLHDSLKWMSDNCTTIVKTGTYQTARELQQALSGCQIMMNACVDSVAAMVQLEGASP